MKRAVLLALLFTVFADCAHREDPPTFYYVFQVLGRSHDVYVSMTYGFAPDIPGVSCEKTARKLNGDRSYVLCMNAAFRSRYDAYEVHQQ